MGGGDPKIKRVFPHHSFSIFHRRKKYIGDVWFFWAQSFMDALIKVTTLGFFDDHLRLCFKNLYPKKSKRQVYPV